MVSKIIPFCSPFNSSFQKFFQDIVTCFIILQGIYLRIS